MRFFKKRRSAEEQYKRYHLARETFTLGILEPGSAQLETAKAEMLRTMGPAFDPTVRGWLRLPLISPAFREFMTCAIDPALEDARDLDAYAEQILAIEAMQIYPVDADVLVEVGRNLTDGLASYRRRELVARGESPEVADEIAFDQGFAVAKRFLSSTQVALKESRQQNPESRTPGDPRPDRGKGSGNAAGLTDERAEPIVPQAPLRLARTSRVAERIERGEPALVDSRTLVVGAGGYATITAAVDASRDGDTILVGPGRYEESVIVNGRTITIRGDGERDAIVVGWDEGPAFTLSATRSTLTGLTIIGGDSVSWFELKEALLVTGGAPRLDGLRISNGRVVFEGGAAGAVANSQFGSDAGVLVRDGASPRIEGNEISANTEAGIEIRGHGSDPLVQANRVQSGTWGILVDAGASPRIEENETSGSSGPGIGIRGAGTDPIVRANRVHNGQGAGILIADGASPRIEENELWIHTHDGILISGVGTDPIVRANRVHDGQAIGILVLEGASPRIEENEIWANVGMGIGISDVGTDPLVRANRVHDGQGTGIYLGKGASARIEENEIWANAMAGIRIDGHGTNPLIRANRVHDGQGPGIVVEATASPRIEENDIWANAVAGIQVGGAGTDPLVRANRVHDGHGPGVYVWDGASPHIEGNEVYANALVGLYIAGSRTAPVITGNTVRDGLDAGIDVLDRASPTITGNRITGNALGDIRVDKDANPKINRNVVQPLI